MLVKAADEVIQGETARTLSARDSQTFLNMLSSDAAPNAALKAAAKRYKAKKGFANYYFNEAAQKKLLASFQRHGDFAPLQGAWSLDGELDRKGTRTPFKVELQELPAEDGAGLWPQRIHASLAAR